MGSLSLLKERIVLIAERSFERRHVAVSLRHICGSATFICMNDKSEFDEEPFKWYYFAFYFCKFIISGDIQFYILRGEKNALH